MPRCGKYIGDNDATCPVLHCVRGLGHPGACDNVNGDYQVFASPDGGPRFPISHVYQELEDAEVVARAATRLLPGFRQIDVASSERDVDLHIDYGAPNPDTGMRPAVVCHESAREMFRRMGW